MSVVKNKDLCSLYCLSLTYSSRPNYAETVDSQTRLSVSSCMCALLKIDTI